MQQEALPLRDIHAAAMPPWWPPAPGWWVLAALGIALLIWLGWVLSKRWRVRRRRSALRDELARVIERHGDADADFLRAMADYCKRLLLHEAGRRDLAVATGSALADELAAPWPEDERCQLAARSIAIDQYRAGGPPPSREALAHLAERWIDRIVLEGAR